MTGTSGFVTPRIVDATFNLRVKNPCYDPSYVSITTKYTYIYGPLKYTLYDGSLAFPIQIMSHSPFEVVGDDDDSGDGGVAAFP